MKAQLASEQMCVPNTGGAQTFHAEIEPVLAKTQASTERPHHGFACRWSRWSKGNTQGSEQKVDGDKTKAPGR